VLSAICLRNFGVLAQSVAMLIDDFTDDGLVSKLGTRWRGVSDQVMGGISEATVSHGVIDGRPSLRMTGDVRLENDGGFIQAALDLAPSGDTLDASDFSGVRIVVRGNGEKYSVHLRTPDNVRPWQSYRAHFTTGLFPSRPLSHIGWKPLWTQRSSAASVWSLLGVRSTPISLFLSLPSIAKLRSAARVRH
jgi:hypothetical protein